MKKITSFLMALVICVGANAQSTDLTPSSNATPSKAQNEQVNLTTSGISQTNVPQNFYRAPTKGVVQIGIDTLTDRYPIHPYFNYSYTQSIYLQSELGAADDITQIWYYFAGDSLSKSNNWTIYMGHTSKTQFSSTSDWMPLTNLTQVYSSTFTDPGASGWILFDITDFAYNGTDNLVIAVDENNDECNTDTDRFFCSSVANKRSLLFYSDYTNPNPSNPPVADEMKAVIPNIRLSFGASSNSIIYWDQMTAGPDGYNSQDFETALDSLDNQGADDFVVTGGPWNIDAISCFGSYGDYGPLEFIHIYFYQNNAGIPGALIAEYLSVPCNTETKSGIVTADLPSTLTLNNGTYWISIVAEMDFNTAGQWWWHGATTTNGSQWMWRNPEDYFEEGAIDWTNATTIWPDALLDLTFALFGSASAGIAEFNVNVSVVPNPSSGIFTITADQNYLVEVYDLTGRIIQSANMNNNNATIDITSESNGMYIIRFINENGTGNVKIIKE